MKRLIRTLAVGATAVLSAVTTAMVVAPSASAEPPCPDAEVVFARGTSEAPGVGGTGQSFVDAVRAQAGARTVGVYAVNYAASSDFNNREEIARTVIDGVRDAGQRIEYMSTACPNTRIVLGGYSQGALVAGFTTSDTAPAGVPAGLVPAALPAAAADHVAAVVLFGTPSEQFLAQYDAPQLVIGPNFADKTLRLCAQGDTICDGGFTGAPTVAHALYGVNGQVNEGAAFAVGRL
ncbi:cutinase family protein [Mycolicibacterium grossiae]|uniref:Cutinase n=1 Tax=Mycolicibacterium grossiae TaxID=1552759 RepID=A0A1E8Q4G3_9MYCO|nr:cutinase family protein [Mycolicibacterium grossiae]